MNTSAEVPSDRADTLKLLVSVTLFAGGIFGFYHFAGHSTLLRVVGLLIVSGAAVAVAYQTSIGRRIWQFVLDSRMEVRKVVWPTRQETVQTTLAVVVMVLLMGILHWLFDMLLMAIVKALTWQGG